MTGTERAALRLALGVLRESLYTHTKYTGRTRRAVVRALGVLPDSLADLWAAADDCLGMPGAADLVPPRILRARLALYLRALLRAERGDVGRWWVGELVGPDGKPVWLFTGYVFARTKGPGRRERKLAQVRRADRDDADVTWNRSHGVDAPQEDWPTRAVVRLARPIWTLAPKLGLNLGSSVRARPGRQESDGRRNEAGRRSGQGDAGLGEGHGES